MRTFFLVVFIISFTQLEVDLPGSAYGFWVGSGSIKKITDPKHWLELADAEAGFDYISFQSQLPRHKNKKDDYTCSFISNLLKNEVGINIEY